MNRVQQNTGEGTTLPVESREVLDQLYDGVYLVDRARVIRYWNRGAERLSGYARDEVVGTRCSDGLLMHVNDAGEILCQTACPLAATIDDGGLREVEVFLHHKDGHRVPVSVRTSPIRDEEGRILGAVEVFSDSSARATLREEIESLKRQALFDPLTEVGNRRYVDIALTSRHDEFLRYGWAYGLLMFDVDHFKSVNDRFGHDTGDRVLRMVAQTLAKNVRSFDVVGRWGGEEFVAVMERLDVEELKRRGETLRRLVEASAISVDGAPLAVTTSVGGTIARPDESPEEVLRRADEFLYRSKTSGRNRCTIA